MRRSTFLLLASLVGLSVGSIAVIAPHLLLAGKVVVPTAQAAIWVREVGVLLLAVSGLAFAVRRHPDSATLRAVLWSNAAVQAGLFPIELAAWLGGDLQKFSGIAPNTALHVVLALAFLRYARGVRCESAPAAFR